MGCVRDAIKFVAMVGYSDKACLRAEVTMRIWTLSHFKEWEEADALRVGDHLVSKSFNVMELPLIVPISLVFSVNRNKGIYVVPNDVKEGHPSHLHDPLAWYDVIICSWTS
jgi:hypothetical protein